MFKNIFWSLLLFPISFLAFTSVFTYYYFAPDLSDKEVLMNKNSGGIILLDRNGQRFFSLGEVRNKKYIPLSKISQYIETAVIASEDREFYIHTGFSPKAIIRALYHDLKNQSLSYGGSTITQQLVKNSLLSPEKKFLRKFQEVILASQIENKHSKSDILEMYLNTVYFGEGAFGVEEAARAYFGKKAQDLTLGESSFLIALLPSPSKLSPLSGGLAEAQKRQRLILEQMADQHYITLNQKEAAEKEQLEFKLEQYKERYSNKLAPHFAFMVKDELAKLYSEEEVMRSGFKVTTTLDPNWQEYTENVVEGQVRLLNSNRVTNAAAVVADPKTGEIKALVGSYNWYNDNFGKVNVAESLRQPGSAFKPIIYAKAMEKGVLTPATILNDKPTTFEGGYRPNNFDKRFRGPVTVRRALANSLNVPSVAVMSQVGVEESIEMARRLGINSLQDPSQYGLSLVLGAGEVTLVEMTESYATFANSGKWNNLTTIKTIEDKNGKIIYQHQPEQKPVLDPGVAFLISSILSDRRARAEVFGNNLNISRLAAVKTGTTENFRDGLTLGYTPSLVVGIWIGNNNGESMRDVAGSLGAAPIWKALMEQFLQGTPVENFEPPEDVLAAQLCLKSGNSLPREALRATPSQEYFLQGSLPSFYCPSSTRVISTSEPILTPTPTPTNSSTPPPANSLPVLSPISSPPTLIPTPTPTPLSIPDFLTPEEQLLIDEALRDFSA